jgi:hypothetical protein
MKILNPLAIRCNFFHRFQKARRGSIGFTIVLTVAIFRIFSGVEEEHPSPDANEKVEIGIVVGCKFRNGANQVLCPISLVL